MLNKHLFNFQETYCVHGLCSADHTMGSASGGFSVQTTADLQQLRIKHKLADKTQFLLMKMMNCSQYKYFHTHTLLLKSSL